MSTLHRVVGTFLSLRDRGERGLSQSTEQAILVAAAVTIGMAIMVAVSSYVAGKLGALGG